MKRECGGVGGERMKGVEGEVSVVKRMEVEDVVRVRQVGAIKTFRHILGFSSSIEKLQAKYGVRRRR